MYKEIPVSSFRNAVIQNNRMNRSIIVLGIISSFLLSFLYIFSPAVIQHFDHMIYDIFLQSQPAISATQEITIIDIDERSLKQYGQWPWPRYRVAELLEKINNHKPSSIALDIIFSEPDRTSIGPLLEEFSKDFNIKAESNNIPETLLNNDKILSKTLQKGPFVLATKFHFDDSLDISENCDLHPLNVFSLKDSKKEIQPSSLFSARSVLCNIMALTNSVSTSGFFNISPDRDGIMRRAPLLIKYEDKVYPSLALAALMKSSGTDQLMMNYSGDRLESLRIKGKSIPVDTNGQIFINYHGPRGYYEYISATDILAGNIPEENIKDKIVFLGTSATGLNEIRATPFDSVVPGVEIHASIADTILAGDFIRTHHWFTGLIFILIIILGSISSIILSSCRSIWGGFFTVLSIVILWYSAQWLFLHEGIFFPVSYLIFSIILLYLLLTIFKFRQEEHKVIARTKELIITQDTTIASMATLAEYRDPEAGGHIKRTREYVKILAENLRHKKKYKNYLTDSAIEMLYKSAPLHDIGKVGIPDNVLLKPGRLNPKEFDIMKEHASMGRDVIKAAENNLGKDSFLKLSKEMAYTHQEKWDGSGYPQGLKGEEIPLSGRLMALADVYDALISRRLYKKPYPQSEAIRIIQISSGKHFDPDIVDAFLDQKEKFRETALKYADFDDEREMLDR